MRPTKEQVDADLAYVDCAETYVLPPNKEIAQRLAAEVRALRAEVIEAKAEEDWLRKDHRALQREYDLVLFKQGGKE